MPYIKQEDRALIAEGSKPFTIGELNYSITLLLKEWWDRKGPSYTVANEIMGAVECAKIEFYRRIVVPYEEQKIKENGDVYGQE